MEIGFKFYHISFSLFRRIFCYSYFIQILRKASPKLKLYNFVWNHFEPHTESKSFFFVGWLAVVVEFNKCQLHIYSQWYSVELLICRHISKNCETKTTHNPIVIHQIIFGCSFRYRYRLLNDDEKSFYLCIFCISPFFHFVSYDTASWFFP